MTFDQWYEETYNVRPEEVFPNSPAELQMLVARRAWEASQRICFEEADIVLDNTLDSAKYSMTPRRLHFFSMGAEVFLRDLKFRLRY